MQFDRLYEMAIDGAERAAVPNKRIENINERLTYDVFLYFQRGLFEGHKIVFGLMLAFAVLVAAGKVCMTANIAMDVIAMYPYTTMIY